MYSRVLQIWKENYFFILLVYICYVIVDVWEI